MNTYSFHFSVACTLRDGNTLKTYTEHHAGFVEAMTFASAYCTFQYYAERYRLQGVDVVSSERNPVMRGAKLCNVMASLSSL
jgi:hypothetical protein